MKTSYLGLSVPESLLSYCIVVVICSSSHLLQDKATFWWSESGTDLLV